MATRQGDQLSAREYGVFKQEYRTLLGELKTWRLDPTLASVRGEVLGFVRGLRFSALLIYSMRRLLQGGGLGVNWGAIDIEGRLSPECDILVHKCGPTVAIWNGSKDPVMDFWFVRREQALAVISCKSKLDSLDSADISYPEKLSPYVNRLWLFAECCDQCSLERLRSSAAAAGYGRFWHLYALTQEGVAEENESGWFEFVREVRQLGSSEKKDVLTHDG